MKFERILPSLNGLSVGQAIRIIEELQKDPQCLKHGTSLTPLSRDCSTGAKNMISYKAA
ncbi:hypothetical protein [Sulfuricurvum sp.]|uniref:hypothetical protein n=1 Tax=Sulfuricurvum sp. TaxID=2025608 RepID=UPI003BB02A93